MPISPLKNFHDMAYVTRSLGYLAAAPVVHPRPHTVTGQCTGRVRCRDKKVPVLSGGLAYYESETTPGKTKGTSHLGSGWWKRDRFGPTQYDLPLFDQLTN